MLRDGRLPQHAVLSCDHDGASARAAATHAVVTLICLANSWPEPHLRTVDACPRLPKPSFSPAYDRRTYGSEWQIGHSQRNFLQESALLV